MKQKIEIPNQSEPVEAEATSEKQKAREYFQRAIADLNAEVRRAIPLLLRDIGIARKTDGEMLAVAVRESFSRVLEQSPTGRDEKDQRAVDALSAIVNHENSLVGNNLTVAEAKEIIGY